MVEKTRSGEQQAESELEAEIGAALPEREDLSTPSIDEASSLPFDAEDEGEP